MGAGYYIRKLNLFFSILFQRLIPDPTLNREQAVENEPIRHSFPHYFSSSCPYMTRASENDGEYPSLWDSHSSPSRNESQLAESTLQQAHSSQLVEHPIQHILNRQRNTINFYNSHHIPLPDSYTDEFITFSHHYDSGMMGQNLFSTFLQPPSLAEPCTSAQASADPPSASAKIEGPSTVMGSQPSVTEPLLEMGFSIKHVKKAIKAIDATGN